MGKVYLQKGTVMRDFSRRRFLEDGIFAAAAAGAAAYATSDAARTQAQTAEPKVGANEQLAMMIVGCGGRGGEHINSFASKKNVRILYLCDADEAHANSRADEFEKKFGYRPKAITDMRRALDAGDLDILSCATTNHWHALTGIWAMQAGLHCYIEKPVCYNVHEGKALVATAKKYGKCCQTGTQCRSNPSNIEAVKFVHEGGIGDVNFARGLCYKRRKAIGPLGTYEPPKTVDYHLWSGPAQILPVTRPNFHYDWHWQRQYGNADLGNQGPHQTDIARWHLGIDRFPNSVISYGGRLGYDVEKKDPNYVDAGDTANTIVSIYDYGDKTMVFETRGLETPDLKGTKIGVIVYGSKGYVVQIDYGYSAAFDLDGNKTQEFKGGGDHFQNFLDAVETCDPSKLAADARCGHLSAGLSHIGNASYYMGENDKVSVKEAEDIVGKLGGADDHLDTLHRTVEHLQANGVDLERTPISMGKFLHIDPQTETFIDDDAANALLTREYRKEFEVPAAETI